MNLSLEEQEVHISMSADDPRTWYVYTDYPKWQRKLEKIGAVLDRVAADGIGKFYTLRANQVSFRKGEKREISDEQRQILSERMLRIRSERSD